MKNFLSAGYAVCTLLLATIPATARPRLSPSRDVGLGAFQFLEINTSTKQNKGARDCAVLLMGPNGVFGCRGSAIVGHDYCSNLNGRVSVNQCGGTLTVDFSQNVPGNTDIHFQSGNGTSTGCTAPSKQSGSSCANTQTGSAAPGNVGSTKYVGSWCVANIVQHQKATPSAPPTDTAAQYSYTITLYDNSTPRKQIGKTSQDVYVAGGATQGMDSLLPSQFQISSGSKYSPILLRSQDHIPNLFSSARFRPIHDDFRRPDL